jgi:transposase-like protein
MNLTEVVLNYLTVNDEGMNHLFIWFLNEVMQEEADQQAGVPLYQRSGLRRAHRNRYRQRSLKTRYGELNLLKPQLREIPCETKVFRTPTISE